MDPLLRLLDANVNRAKEGLRVLEDLARFVLDDAPLARRAKRHRHALRAAAEALGLDPFRAAANRDTPRDVGRALKTSAEARRDALPDLAAAAAKRAQEALRVLAEAAKTLPGAAPARTARDLEAIRYDLYDLESALLLRLGTGRAPQWRLCLLLTESLCRRPWKSVLAAALDAGVDCIQIREKALPDRDLLARTALVLRAARARPAGRPRPAVILNDRPDLALLAGADGVHLGQTDLPVAAVRALAGNRLLVGVSAHSLAEARRARRDGADYLGLGAMFPTTTKPRPTAGPAFLRRALRDAKSHPVPHLAIGGITPANLPALIQAGARGVAVSAAICAADDPGAVCRQFLRLIPR